MQWRLRQRHCGQDPNSSGQPSRYHWPVKGKTSVPVLHPSLDADGSRREVIRQGASACTTPARRCSQSTVLPKNCSARNPSLTNETASCPKNLHSSRRVTEGSSTPRI